MCVAMKPLPPVRRTRVIVLTPQVLVAFRDNLLDDYGMLVLFYMYQRKRLKSCAYIKPV